MVLIFDFCFTFSAIFGHFEGDLAKTRPKFFKIGPKLLCFAVLRLKKLLAFFDLRLKVACELLGFSENRGSKLRKKVANKTKNVYWAPWLQEDFRNISTNKDGIE